MRSDNPKNRPKTQKELRFFYNARLSYVLLLVVALVFASLEGGAIPGGVLTALLLIIPVSALYAFCAKRWTRIQHRLDSQLCIRGEEVGYRCDIQNTSILSLAFICLRVSATRSLFKKSFARISSCGPKEILFCQTRLTPSHRGVYHIHVQQVLVSDIFGLFRFSVNTPQDLELVALPRIA